MATFEHVQVGDTVLRMLGGVVPMRLSVTAVDELFIYCGSYIFSRWDGCEHDDDLRWHGKRTGSRLVREANP